MTRLIAKPLRLLTLALLAAAVVTGCGGTSLPKNVVAMVGKVPITKATYEHWLSIYSDKHVPGPPNYTACVKYLRSVETRPAPASAPDEALLKETCASEYTDDKDKTVKFLVEAQRILGEAKEAGVSVDNEEIEQEIKLEEKDDFHSEADFKRYVQERGLTRADLTFRAEIELLPHRIEERIAAEAEKSITKREIEKYYNEHASEYDQPESRGAYILLAKTKAEASAAKAEIEAGASFTSAAKRVTIFHTSERGGVYLTGFRGDLPEQSLESALFAAKVGVLTGPLPSSAGYYVFEVTKSTLSGPKELKLVGDKIGSQLAFAKVKAELARRSLASATKWRAKTTCAPEYVVSVCKEDES